MKDETTKIFGDRLRDARKKKRLSQKQLAEQIGLRTHMAVNNWENGRDFPGLGNLVDTAALLDVSIDWLVWGNQVGNGIEARLKKIPPILRDGLVSRLHQEIDETEKLAARLPPELNNGVVKDSDPRLYEWSIRNRKPSSEPSKRPKKDPRRS